MTQWLLENESITRLSIFLGTLITMLVLEKALPNRRWQPSLVLPSLAKRQLLNVSLTVLNTVALRALPFASAATASLWAATNNFGVFQWLDLSSTAKFALTIFLLDLCIYWQHRYFHHNAFLWNLHKVHHCDTHLDASTALRFHPLEIIISMLVKSLVAVLLGVPLIGLIAFEILLNASALFNHANIKLNKATDKTLRAIIVTPDMHTVHHSTDKQETNSNYGFFLSIWDRIFGSYTASSKLQPTKIGISEVDPNDTNSVYKLLKLPVTK